MKSKIISQYDVISALRLPLIVLVTYTHSYGGVTEGYCILGSGWVLRSNYTFSTFYYFL